MILCQFTSIFLSTLLLFQQELPWAEVYDREKWWPTTFIYHLYSGLGYDTLIHKTGKEFDAKCQDLHFCFHKSHDPVYIPSFIYKIWMENLRTWKISLKGIAMFSVLPSLQHNNKTSHQIILSFLCSLFSNIAFMYNIWESDYLGFESWLLAGDMNVSYLNLLIHKMEITVVTASQSLHEEKW